MKLNNLNEQLPSGKSESIEYICPPVIATSNKTTFKSKLSIAK